MDILLGKEVSYPDQYDAGLLFPVSRRLNRATIGLNAELPFFGYDHWRGYEISWLNSHGMPQVAMADILVPCSSPNLIESKSMKLYLNSLNQHRFQSREQLSDCIQRDLGLVAGSEVVVRINDLENCRQALVLEPAQSELLDHIQLTEPVFQVDSSLLSSASSTNVDVMYVSHLFRSNCPVTSQPDWGSILIDYSGPEPDKSGLLKYILSYRLHEGFHEHCVERIFMDIMSTLKPLRLIVSINFTRRGGLEINPVRSTCPQSALAPLARFVRQ